MNRFFKTSMYISAALLIVLDAFSLFGLSGLEVQLIFANAMYSLAPCSLLVGITAILFQNKKRALKPFAGISLGVNLIFLVFWILAVAMQISTFKTADTVIYEEYLMLVQMLGYTVLLLANIFLMVYCFAEKLRTPALVLFGISALTLIIDWVLMVISNMNYYVDNGGTGIWGKILAGFNADVNLDFIKQIVVLAAYIVIFLATTRTLDDKKEVSNG